MTGVPEKCSKKRNQEEETTTRSGDWNEVGGHTHGSHSILRFDSSVKPTVTGCFKGQVWRI